MQRNPYWPLNGPSFFAVLIFRRGVFSRCTKVGFGFGQKFSGTDGKPTIKTLASLQRKDIQGITRHPLER